MGLMGVAKGCERGGTQLGVMLVNSMSSDTIV